MPENDDAWVKYIQAFVRFLLERYGREEVESWYFEVWNEPDLGIIFFDGTRSDYLHLYEITARAIKEVDSNIKVGGPSTSGSKWIAAFVRFCKENNVPVDFVSTHQYAGDPLGGIQDAGGVEDTEESELDIDAVKAVFNPEVLKAALADLPKNQILPAFRVLQRDQLENEDVPNHTFRTHAPIVKEQAQGLPVFYTEWNTSATFSAYTNDTRKVAAYDVKTVLALEDVIDGSSIWSFSDIFEEFHPFPEEFHGGFGLMTQSGIKKPVYHAMKMLADAGDQRYDMADALDGEIGMAAFRAETEIQVLLFRQKLKNLFDLPKEKAVIKIEMAEAPKRVYVQRIDAYHCNPLAVWEEMGSPQMPTPVQLKQIVEKSAMVEEEWPCRYHNGSLEVTAELGVNDLYFVRIEMDT